MTFSMRRQVPLVTLTAIVVLMVNRPCAAEQQDPRFEPCPCPFDEENELVSSTKCGTLIVPEDRSRQTNKRQIELSVAIVKATGTDRQDDPVVYLSGGPGESALDSLARWETQPLRLKRDVVLFDQRGTGHSGALCPGLFGDAIKIMARDSSAEEDIADHAKAVAECRRSLVERGVSPNAYNSSETAADVEDLRRALGYAQINLLGVSYGTRVALTAMKDLPPSSIRSVVLDSGLAIEEDFYGRLAGLMSDGFRTLSSECAQAPECGSHIDDLEQELQRLLDHLDEQPLEISLDLPELLPNGRFVVNSQDLLTILGELLHDGGVRRLIPAIVRGLNEGHSRFLVPLLEVFLSEASELDLGAYYAVQCHEEFPFASFSPPSSGQFGLEEIGLLGAVEASCEQWQAVEPDPLDNLDVRSTIPALVFNGEFDSRAPPRYGKRIVSNLENGSFFEVPGGGHSLADDECVRQMIGAFLDDPDQRPDSACLRRNEPQAPLANVELRGGILSLLLDLGRRELGPLIWAGLTILLLFALQMIWIIRFVRWLRRRGRSAPVHDGGQPWWRTGSAARLTLDVASLLSVIFVVALVKSVIDLLGGDDTVVLLVGLLSSSAWIFVPLRLAIFTTLLGFGAVIPTLRGGSWTIPTTIHSSAVMAVNVSFFLFLYSRQML